MSFTYYVIKNEDVYGKLNNDDRMIDYVYGPDSRTLQNMMTSFVNSPFYIDIVLHQWKKTC